MGIRNKNTLGICKNKFSVNNSDYQFKGVISRIIKEVAEEHNLSITEVKLMVISTLYFTKKMLSRSVKLPLSLDNVIKVRWKYFGSFQVAIHRVKKFFATQEKNKEAC